MTVSSPSHRERARIYTHSTVFEPLQSNENVNVYSRSRQRNILAQQPDRSNADNKRSGNADTATSGRPGTAPDSKSMKQSQLRGAGDILGSNLGSEPCYSPQRWKTTSGAHRNFAKDDSIPHSISGTNSNRGPGRA